MSSNNNYKHWLLGVLLGCACCWFSGVVWASSAEPVQLSQQQIPIYLTPSNVQYVVEGHPSDGQRVLRQDDSLQWLNPNKPSINLGKSERPFWVRFQVNNPSPQPMERTLEIQWIHLASLEMYQVSEQGELVAHHKAGLLYDPAQHYQHSDTILLPIKLGAGEMATVLLKVETSFIAFLPMVIWPEDARLDAEFSKYVLYAVAFGILVAMMLYNASLFVFTRDKSYFYYSLYVSAIIAYLLGSSGIGVYLVWADSQWMRMNGYGFSIYFSFICAAFFVRHFLDLKEYGGWLLHLNTAVILVWGVLILDLFMGSNLRSLAELLSLVTCVLASYTSVYLWFKGNVSARYFTIAWSFLIFSTVLTILMIEGVIAQSLLTEYGQMAGFVLEVLMLSFAMAERINRERVSREHAQADALRYQVMIGKEREDRLTAQEQLLEMQKRTNEKLEIRVKQRTEELERTMTNLEIANKELSKLSITDPLTKVHNRRYFDEVLQREIQRAQRTGQPLSLILVDIDHFKQFNDRYGHLVGDDCLRLVASVLSKEIHRASDLVARFGGEEFVIILADSSEEEAMELAERVRIAIAELQFIYGGKRIPISASMGVAGKVPTSTCTARSYVDAADQALYRAKEEGRNCCVQAKFTCV